MLCFKLYCKVNQDGLAKRDTEYLTDGTRYELDVRAIINDNETGEFEFKGFSNTSFDLEYANNKSDADATLKLFFDSGNKQTFYLKQRK